MRTKREARIWAHALLVKTLRNRAAALTRLWVKKVSGEEVLTDKQLERAREAMLELADKLEAKLRRLQGETDEPGTGTE